MSIDAVITWVDGNDPVHRARLAAYLVSQGGPPPPAARSTRFDDAGELDFCVDSILRFAPWIRRIHIVTAGQSPPLLQRLAGSVDTDRVRVVDHEAVYAGFEQHLPTFNSRAIITTLWRIPGLAEQFLYFNDDFVLLQPVQPEDFFRDDRVVLRGRWRAQGGDGLLARLRAQFKRLRGGGADHAGHRDAQQVSARLAGVADRYFALPHVPYPMRRSTLQSYFEAHPDRLAANVAPRLRASSQFKTESVSAHLEIAADNADFDDRLTQVQLNPRAQTPATMRARMQRADRDTSVAFACVQSLDLAEPAMRAEILAWLDRRIRGA